MDKTLGDYIKRIQGEEQNKQEVWHNRNIWNDHNLAKDDYLVYPEPQSQDSDEKRNPYSKV